MLIEGQTAVTIQGDLQRQLQELQLQRTQERAWWADFAFLTLQFGLYLGFVATAMILIFTVPGTSVNIFGPSCWLGLQMGVQGQRLFKGEPKLHFVATFCVWGHFMLCVFLVAAEILKSRSSANVDSQHNNSTAT